MSREQFEVYLAGPITGCNKDQIERWRQEFKNGVNKLRNDVEFYDPAAWTHDWAPLRETLTLRSVDVVVANMWKESVGTTIGIMQAVDVGKPVVLIDPSYLNSTILNGIIHPEKPVHTVAEAAHRLSEILDAFRQIVVLKTTCEPESFDREKLVASIQTACGAAKVPDMLFAQQISARVLQKFRSSGSTEAIPTTAIKDAIFDVLADLSTNSIYDKQVRADAAAVTERWMRKEKYKSGDLSVEAVRAELMEARAEADRYRDLWKQAAEVRNATRLPQPPPFGDTAPLPRLPERRFKDVSAVLEAIATQWPDTLLVLPSARKSAKGYPFRDTERAYKALDILGQCAFERMLDKAERRLGKSIAKSLEEHRDCFEYADGETGETMRRYAKERTFTCQGREYVCAKHLKVGTHGGAEKALRVYFAEDPETRRFVIGHVGEHLPTYGVDG